MLKEDDGSFFPSGFVSVVCLFLWCLFIASYNHVLLVCTAWASAFNDVLV